MRKLESSLINMVLVLTGVAIIMSIVLASVNHITSEPIALQQQKALADGIKAVMQADDICVSRTDTVQQTDDSGKPQLFLVYQNELGAAVESTTNGFGGKLRVLVGFNNQGKILGYTILEHAETPGLGAKVTEWFQSGQKSSIIGLSPAKPLTVSKDGGTIDAITASTITSRAFLLAVNNAYRAYKTMSIDEETAATPQTKDKKE
ncbi:RnfABCDGE type electron transport complex subunit G [Xylanibacter brevis]|uniref:RnfABCDGE type electron transport complex subunit G n=1 Tax=Xylanibacter brevis TaxID=83231 RepID=UPI000487FD78|nr:RnfABCDGE type electron transport complex subunit G [Xylanibacter brevis]